uniref:Uncharacterized protein n=1 Tax=Romanomermis culicivorax TaxID=13658 RepID=A0A915JSI8_ROMCU
MDPMSLNTGTAKDIMKLGLVGNLVQLGDILEEMYHIHIQEALPYWVPSGLMKIECSPLACSNNVDYGWQSQFFNNFDYQGATLCLFA